jgi:TolB-like protein
VKRIGRELGVRYVLEGSVRKSGQRVRVNAQLIDAETGGYLWADRFEREVSDLFALHVAVEPGVDQHAKGQQNHDKTLWARYALGTFLRELF